MSGWGAGKRRLDYGQMYSLANILKGFKLKSVSSYGKVLPVGKLILCACNEHFPLEKFSLEASMEKYTV